jgi:hypothetical protein
MYQGTFGRPAQLALDTRPSVTGRTSMIVYPTARVGGRRILVVSSTGYVLYDTMDCYDFANAMDRVSQWLTTPEGLALAARGKL